MRHRVKRAAMILAVLSLLPVLSGCWDNYELDSLFIVTGVAMDKAEDPEKMDITIQIGKTQSSAQSSSQSSPSKGNSILVRKTAGTMLEGIYEIDRSSSRTLLLQHNQVLLFGTELAKMGIRERIDLFMRDQDTRLEVMLLVVDGQAGEILEIEPEQEKISGVYVARILNDMKKVSPHHVIRLLDFASRLLEETSAPVMPLAKIVTEKDKKRVEIEGLALFRGDQMVGSLDNEQTRGYLWAMGDVRLGGVIAKTDLGEVAFSIVALDTQRKVEVLPTGRLHIELVVNATLEVGDLSGFKDVSAEDLVPYLRGAAQDKIRRQILETFEIAQSLGADIYQFGVTLHRKDAKKWMEMKDTWAEHFAQADLDVQLRINITSMGQTSKSLEMQEDRYEN